MRKVLGKYHRNKEPNWAWISIIANELAEANRLKRLDMRNDYLVYDDMSEDEFKEELEDGA
ncbi:hypothetical protein LCGC14_0586430 [marine sediment metagenome]|uniref:Uncharacterized protein n=1 Tax=marine sediment metagenome TaxID=412755 RepID=A0A0F9RYN0_9ZZZZ